MELHFIILTVLSTILLIFIILAICAYCCGDLCCSCCCASSSSYSHSRESYHNETVTNGTKTTSKGEYHNENYTNNGQILPLLMPTKPSDFEVNESHSTPLLTKHPPEPLGFGYPIETSQEEITEMPQPDYYPPAERVVTTAPHPVSKRTPHPESSHHVETISYTTTTPNNQSNFVETPRSVNFNQAPLPKNQNHSYSSTQINQRSVLDQQDPRNIETVHHVKSISHAPSKQIYSEDVEASQVKNSHKPTKNVSHSETDYNRTEKQYDPEIIERSYQVETGPYCQNPPFKHIYTRETNEMSHPVGDAYRFKPIKDNSLDLQEREYYTRSGSCPPDNESIAKDVYPSGSHRNKTLSTRTVTYSSENIAPYPISIRAANSVDLLPSTEVEFPYNQGQLIKGPFRKQSSQVSLYDNV